MALDKRELEALVERAQGGDEQAFSLLFEEGRQNVYYLGLQMLKNEQDALDLTQEVFLIVYRRLSGLKNRSAFFGWLRQIAVNQCKNRLAKDDFVLLSGEEPDGEAPDEPELSAEFLPQDAAEREEISRTVLDFVSALPPEQRLCVLLYYYEQLRVGEVAAVLGVSENTVKSRLNYARKKLRLCVEEKHKEGFRLYSISVPMLLWALSRDCAAHPAALPVSAVLQGAGAAGGALAAGARGAGDMGAATQAGAGAAAAASVGTAAAGAAATASAGAATGAAAAAGTALWIKLVASLALAASVVLGGNAVLGNPLFGNGLRGNYVCVEDAAHESFNFHSDSKVTVTFFIPLECTYYIKGDTLYLKHELLERFGTPSYTFSRRDGALYLNGLRYEKSGAGWWENLLRSFSGEAV